MSRESAVSFLARMRCDHAFSQNVLDCKDPESRLSFARSEGYNVSREDFNSGDQIEVPMTTKNCCVGPNED